jgi:hypothetical protein
VVANQFGAIRQEPNVSKQDLSKRKRAFGNNKPSGIPVKQKQFSFVFANVP